MWVRGGSLGIQWAWGTSVLLLWTCEPPRDSPGPFLEVRHKSRIPRGDTLGYVCLGGHLRCTD